MKSKQPWTVMLGFTLALLALSGSPLFGFVHISSVKPRLPVSPSQPMIVFQWNGDAPELSDKDAVLGGAYKDASDSELMAVLLQEAVKRWNKVESSYLRFDVIINSGVVADRGDEIYAIYVESQDSQTVAAAALPVFVSDNPGASPNQKSGRVIFDCDISVSSSSVSAKSLLKTLVHEMGHCLGLGHPHSNYHSIMSYANISDSPELGLDDKAGVSFLYPAAGTSQKVKNLTSCGAIARPQRGYEREKGEGSTRSSGVTLLLLPAGVVFWRRRGSL